MSNQILAKYYEGIWNQLQGEVDFVNEVFQHQGLKGEGNETAIRELIKRFIPRRYGVGSGIVIDSSGNPSKQCDIVIYDNYDYPEILSLTSLHIYPVDLVYATIEVKTTIDSEKSRQAIDNIKSVRSLHFIEDSFRISPTGPVYEVRADTTIFETTATIPPIGMVFAYRSETSNFETFANWFTKVDQEDTTSWPSHVFCLDQGMLVAPGWEKRMCCLFPLATGDEYHTAEPGTTKEISGKDWADCNGRHFPVSTAKGKAILIDQSKILLNFVLLLTESLKQKHLSPHVTFRQHYLTENLATVFVVSENQETLQTLNLSRIGKSTSKTTVADFK